MKRLLLFLLLIGSGMAFGQAISGNITTNGSDCLATTAACVTAKINSDIGSALVSISGTFTGTLQFETCDLDGSNCASTNATPLNSTTAVTSATSTGKWRVNVAASQQVQVRASAFSNGTAAVKISFGKPSASVGGAGAGTVTKTGTLTANGVVVGNGGADVKVSGNCTDDGTTLTCAGSGGVVAGPGLASDSSTTNSKLAKLSGGNVVAATTGDTNVPVWIVASGGGTAAVYLASAPGQATCVFDGATTAGHYVIASASSAADCSDGGATLPTGKWVIGQVLTTNGGTGTYAVQLAAGYSPTAGGGYATLKNNGSAVTSRTILNVLDTKSYFYDDATGTQTIMRVNATPNLDAARILVAQGRANSSGSFTLVGDAGFSTTCTNAAVNPSSTVLMNGTKNTTAASGNAGCQWNGTNNVFYFGGGYAAVRAAFAISSASSSRGFVGFGQQTGMVTADDPSLTNNKAFMGFFYTTTTDSTWQACTGNGTNAKECANTAVTVDTDPHRFLVESTSNSAVKFWIDGVCKVSTTASDVNCPGQVATLTITHAPAANATTPNVFAYATIGGSAIIDTLYSYEVVVATPH